MDEETPAQWLENEFEYLWNRHGRTQPIGDGTVRVYVDPWGLPDGYRFPGRMIQIKEGHDIGCADCSIKDPTETLRDMAFELLAHLL
jgi:hypothetical protein